MSKFADNVKQDTPRLVVKFNRGADGSENFDWGIVGVIPIITLIGYIERVQSELFFRCPDPCDQPALVVTWDAKKRECAYYVHPDVPVDPLVGILEIIQSLLVSSKLAQQVVGRNMLLGPDGKPARR